MRGKRGNNDLSGKEHEKGVLPYKFKDDILVNHVADTLNNI